MCKTKQRREDNVDTDEHTEQIQQQIQFQENEHSDAVVTKKTVMSLLQNHSLQLGNEQVMEWQVCVSILQNLFTNLTDSCKQVGPDSPHSYTVLLIHTHTPFPTEHLNIQVKWFFFGQSTD